MASIRQQTKNPITCPVSLLTPCLASISCGFSHRMLIAAWVTKNSSAVLFKLCDRMQHEIFHNNLHGRRRIKEQCPEYASILHYQNYSIPSCFFISTRNENIFNSRNGLGHQNSIGTHGFKNKYSRRF